MEKMGYSEGSRIESISLGGFELLISSSLCAFIAEQKVKYCEVALIQVGKLSQYRFMKSMNYKAFHFNWFYCAWSCVYRHIRKRV